MFTIEPNSPLPQLGTSNHSITETPITITNGISKLLSQLKIDKASGPDAISTRVLKELHSESAPILTTIFRKYLLDGKLSKDWKMTNVVPVFKKE